MNTRFYVLLLAAFFALGHCHGQGTIQITFDGPPVIPADAQYGVTSYFESGMLFTATNTTTHNNEFTRNNAANSGYPDDGSAYLQSGPNTLMFSFTNGSPFGLVSVDLAEYSTVFSNQPVTVPFIGFLQDGSTVTNIFTTDGIIDGTGPLADFQTFQFTGFTGLTRVEIPFSNSDPLAWSLDNLVVSVPEPSAVSLICLGSGIFIYIRHRFQTRRKRP